MDTEVFMLLIQIYNSQKIEEKAKYDSILFLLCIIAESDYFKLFLKMLLKSEKKELKRLLDNINAKYKELEVKIKKIKENFKL